MEDALIPPKSAIDNLWGTAAFADYDSFDEGLLLKHQREWIEDDSPLKVAVKGRRTGITWAEGFSSVLTASATKTAGGDNVFYIGDTEEKGREFIKTCSAFAERIAKELLQVEEFLFNDQQEDGTSKYITAWRITFASGFQITALSSRPANIRGLQGYVIIDEAAFHKDVAKVLDACLALLIWGGKIRIISTHNGKGSAFNHLIEEIADGTRPGKVHHIPFDIAVENGLYERVCAVRGLEPSPEGKAEWYTLIRASYGKRLDAMHEEMDCIPRDDAEGPWLSWDLIINAEHEDSGKPELYQGGPVYMGNDIARRGDLWVLWVWELIGDVFWCREIVELRNASFSIQDATMDEAIARYQTRRVAMDQTGMGEKPVEDAKTRHGWKIEGVIFSASNRLDVATLGKKKFEDIKVRIPAKNADLRNDLHKLKRVTGPTGNPRLVADSDEHGHADRTWAAFLGLASAPDKPGIIDFYEQFAAQQKEKNHA